MSDKLNNIRNEIRLLCNSLNYLFENLHAHQAKIKLIEARWWSESAISELVDDIGVGGSE